MLLPGEGLWDHAGMSECTVTWPVWRTDKGRGLYLADAGPQIWLGCDMLQDLLDSMPLFPVALVSTDFTACPEGHYEPGDGAVGAVLRFDLDDGRRLVYQIVRFDLIRWIAQASGPPSPSVAAG